MIRRMSFTSPRRKHRVITLILTQMPFRPFPSTSPILCDCVFLDVTSLFGKKSWCVHPEDEMNLFSIAAFNSFYLPYENKLMQESAHKFIDIIELKSANHCASTAPISIRSEIDWNEFLNHPEVKTRFPIKRQIPHPIPVPPIAYLCNEVGHVMSCHVIGHVYIAFNTLYSISTHLLFIFPSKKCRMMIATAECPSIFQKDDANHLHDGWSKAVWEFT